MVQVSLLLRSLFHSIVNRRIELFLIVPQGQWSKRVEQVEQILRLPLQLPVQGALESVGQLVSSPLSAQRVSQDDGADDVDGERGRKVSKRHDLTNRLVELGHEHLGLPDDLGEQSVQVSRAETGIVSLPQRLPVFPSHPEDGIPPDDMLEILQRRRPGERIRPLRRGLLDRLGQLRVPDRQRARVHDGPRVHVKERRLPQIPPDGLGRIVEMSVALHVRPYRFHVAPDGVVGKARHISVEGAYSDGFEKESCDEICGDTNNRNDEDIEGV